jgi:hypothetical protein
MTPGVGYTVYVWTDPVVGAAHIPGAGGASPRAQADLVRHRTAPRPRPPRSPRPAGPERYRGIRTRQGSRRKRGPARGRRTRRPWPRSNRFASRTRRPESEQAARGAGRRARCLPRPHAAERVGQRGAGEHDERDDRGDQPQTGEGDPERQLVGPIRGDVEHASHQAGLRSGAGYGAVHGIEQETEEEQGGAGESDRRRSQIEHCEAGAKQGKPGERDPGGHHALLREVRSPWRPGVP